MKTHQSYIIDINNLQIIKIYFSMYLYPNRNESDQCNITMWTMKKGLNLFTDLTKLLSQIVTVRKHCEC